MRSWFARTCSRLKPRCLSAPPEQHRSTLASVGAFSMALNAAACQGVPARSSGAAGTATLEARFASARSSCRLRTICLACGTCPLKRCISRIESRVASGIAVSNDACTAPGSAQQLASGSAACAMSVSSLPRASMKRHTPPSTESAAHPPAARRAENASVSPGTRMMKTVACLKPFMPSFFLCWAVLMLRLFRSMAPKPKSVTPLACVMISLSSAKRSADSNVCTGSLVFFFCCRLVRP